jgi:hypothetical protein
MSRNAGPMMLLLGELSFRLSNGFNLSFPPELSDMSDTQDAAANASAPAEPTQTVFDCESASKWTPSYRNVRGR